MKKVLSILLAIFCVMNLTVVSFAAEEVSHFDEETGTLYMMTENWFEDLGIEETDEALFAFCGKVKTVYFDEECGIADNFTYCLYFYNLEKIVVDEDSTEWFVYDNALYYNAVSDGEEVCGLVYYPAKCPDKDIVLHPDATQILLSTFYVYDVVIDTIFMNENEYNLYVVDEGQFQKIVNNSAGEGNFMNLKFTNIYVNDAQESIDAIGKSFNYSFETYNKRLEYECFTVYYLDCNAGNDEKCDEVLNRIGKITNEIECPEDTDDTAAMSEYYDTLYSRVSEYINTLDYVEYTEEAHALAGRPVEEYAYYKAEIDYCYNLYLFFNNRGNPVKPLSTLTSGTCGKGVEWAIDRENGVLSITGNGAIADNYSGFDVFKDIVATVGIGNGITAIGENVFTGFTALTETKFDGTQVQWDAVAVAEGNDDLLKNVTVNPDPIVEPEEEPTLGDKIVGFFNKISNFFIKVFDWFKNLLGI